MARQFREEFIAAVGDSNCEAIRDGLPEIDKRCQPVVFDAVRILVELLEEDGLVIGRPGS